MGENIDLLVKELCKLPAETGWLEVQGEQLRSYDDRSGHQCLGK